MPVVRLPVCPEPRPTVSDASLQPILALLGSPVAANPTQYMTEKAFAQQQLDFRFLTLEVKPDDLGDAIRGMRAMGFVGGVCVDPHRETVGAHLARLSEAATLSGIVNCIYRDGDDLVGENTEGKGLVTALAQSIGLGGKRVLLLGAGKIARSIAVELALAKVGQIVVAGRTPERVESLVGLLREKLKVPAVAQPWEDPLVVPGDAEILINATSVGREDSDGELPLAPDALRRNLIVADVTLDPPRTRLLAAAQDAGCPTVDGLELFVQQSAVNIQRWTGVEPDTTVMREAVEEFLLL